MKSQAYHQQQQLPIVSSLDDHAEWNEIAVASGGTEFPLSEATDATVELLQDDELCAEIGIPTEDIVDRIGQVLARYETPLGLANKLLVLNEFAVLEFLVDDSGSMNTLSNSIHPGTGRLNSRWGEAMLRIIELLELLAYFSFQKFELCFLNRNDRMVVQRQGRTPAAFLEDARAQLDLARLEPPMGSTPALEKMTESFGRSEPGLRIARYFFCDGIPDGGRQARDAIVSLLQNRRNPEENPITFLSCTSQDDQVEWMKDAEEVVPYCSEADDYQRELQEVRRDQGEALPYTKGFYLVCCLVAAMNPDDLDAMDESVPFTKTTLDNLLGLEYQEASYKLYFESFQTAQRVRRIEGPADALKKRMEWNYYDFLAAPMAKDIPQVKQYRQQLASVMAASSPVAEAQALPPDWNPQTAEVVNIPMAEAVILDPQII